MAGACWVQVAKCGIDAELSLHDRLAPVIECIRTVTLTLAGSTTDMYCFLRQPASRTVLALMLATSASTYSHSKLARQLALSLEVCERTGGHAEVLDGDWAVCVRHAGRHPARRRAVQCGKQRRRGLRLRTCIRWGRSHVQSQHFLGEETMDALPQSHFANKVAPVLLIVLATAHLLCRALPAVSGPCVVCAE